jgi:hypothetical protein
MATYALGFCGAMKALWLGPEKQEGSVGGFSPIEQVQVSEQCFGGGVGLERETA